MGRCGLVIGPRGRRGKASVPSSTDRGKPGSKHHLLTDARRTPLVAQLTAPNVHDGTKLLDLIDAIPPVRGKVSAPKRKPDSVTADKAYHSRLREMLPVDPQHYAAAPASWHRR